MATKETARIWKRGERRVIARETTADGYQYMVEQECAGFWWGYTDRPLFEYYVYWRSPQFRTWQQACWVRKNGKSYGGFYYHKRSALHWLKKIVAFHNEHLEQ